MKRTYPDYRKVVGQYNEDTARTSMTDYDWGLAEGGSVLYQMHSLFREDLNNQWQNFIDSVDEHIAAFSELELELKLDELKFRLYEMRKIPNQPSDQKTYDMRVLRESARAALQAKQGKKVVTA